MFRLLKRRGWQDIGPARRDPRFSATAFRIMARDYRAP
jgi:hypothetical protein